MDQPNSLDAPRRLTSIDAYRGFVMFLMMAEVLHLGAVAKAMPDSRFCGRSSAITRRTSSGSAARCTT